MFLAVAMAAANALFNALRVPGKVIINDQRTKLQVDAFRRRFRGN
jgi:hypothetical protein